MAVKSVRSNPKDQWRGRLDCFASRYQSNIHAAIWHGCFFNARIKKSICLAAFDHHKLF